MSRWLVVAVAVEKWDDMIGEERGPRRKPRRREKGMSGDAKERRGEERSEKKTPLMMK